MSSAQATWTAPKGSEQLGWGLLISVGIHLVLVAFLMFWPGWGFSKRQIFAPIYQVNLVGAPPMPAAAPAPAPAAKPAAKPVAKPAPAPKPAPKAKEAVAVKKEPDKKAERIKREKKKSPEVDTSAELDKKIRRLRSKVREEQRIDAAINRIESKVGQQAGSGAVAPSGGNQLSVRFQIYYTQLWERIRKSWVLPEALVHATKGLEAVVVARITKTGALERVWLEKGSGNSRYDASALRAVERAAPFPPLPAGIRERVHEVGFRFRAEDIKNS